MYTFTHTCDPLLVALEHKILCCLFSTGVCSCCVAAAAALLQLHQAVVKEGTGGAGRLAVKLSVEKPKKGNPNFARRLLGLPDLTPAQTLQGVASVRQRSGGDKGQVHGSQPGGGDVAAAVGRKSLRFGSAGGEAQAEAAEEGDAASTNTGSRSGGGSKGDDTHQWNRMVSGRHCDIRVLRYQLSIMCLLAVCDHGAGATAAGACEACSSSLCV